jgi:integrase
MLLLAAFCGLRTREMATLHWTDLQVSGNRTPALLVSEGKDCREQVVPVPSVVLMALEDYGRRASGPMFPAKDGSAIKPDALASSLNRYLRRTGLVWTASQLRHLHKSAEYQRLATDPKSAQAMLGHGSLDRTDSCPTCRRPWAPPARVNHLARRTIVRGSTHRPTVDDLGLLRRGRQR